MIAELILAAALATGNAAITEINEPAQPIGDDFAPALRVDPPDPPPPVTPPPPPAIPFFSSANDGHTCHGAIPLLQHYSPGWDVNRMARIMWRESNCQPGAMNSSSSASGLLQLLANLHCPWIRQEFGDCSRQWLADPYNNIRAAASLYRRAGGTDPWAQTR